jgi:hypothetical protein
MKNTRKSIVFSTLKYKDAFIKSIFSHIENTKKVNAKVSGGLTRWVGR